MAFGFAKRAAALLIAIPTRYTVALLQDWKADAERIAELEIAHGAVPDVAADIAALQLNTERIIATANCRRTIETPDAGAVHLERTLVGDVERAFRAGNLLLVSEAGAGKSAVLLDVAERLAAANERVIFLDATDRRLVDPRSYFSLVHSLEEVLQRWAEADRPGFVLIDGLDAMRAGASFETLLRVIRALQEGGTPWHVLAATRDYDLESAAQLRALFPAANNIVIPSHLTEARFRSIAHIAVRALEDEDFAVLGARSPALANLWAGASPDLRLLLRNPFNLSIAANLTIGGDPVDLSYVHKRVQLLDLWWSWRVIARTEAGYASQREPVLRALCQLMLERRELRAPAEEVQGGACADVLLSDGVLTRLGRYGEFVAFAHAIIFDYAVYRLFLQAVSINEFLERDRELALFALPSVRMRFVELWENDQTIFYNELRILFVSRQRRTLLMAASRTIAENSRCIRDVDPLLAHADEAGSMAVRYLVRNLIHLSKGGLSVAGADAGPWCELALRVAQGLPRHEHDGLLLLHECLKSAAPPTGGQSDFLAHAARLYLRHQLRADAHEPVRAGMAITAFIKTYDVSPRLARPYLDRLLDPRRIARLGRYELQPLAFEVKRLHDPDALLAIYRRVFSDVSVGEGQIDIGRRSAVMSMVQDASQTLSMARWALGERFASFLQEHPDAAIIALADVLDQVAQHRQRFQALTIHIEGRQLVLMHDHSNMREIAVYALEPWAKMANAFDERLRAELETGHSELFLLTLTLLSDGAHGMYLWRILLRHAGRLDESARAIGAMMACKEILLALELGEPAADYLRTGYPRLPMQMRENIDTALLGLPQDVERTEHIEYRQRRLEQFASELPRDFIVLPELRAIADKVTAEHWSSARERQLRLSGSTTPAAWVTTPLLSEGARSAGASDALARAIDAARPLLTLTSGQPPHPSALILRAVDRIEAAAVDATAEARAHGFDVICALIRVALEHQLVSASDRPRLMSLLLQGLDLPDSDDSDSSDSESDLDQEQLSWGSPWRLADGVQALGRLLRQGFDQRIVDVLRRLAVHTRASIRYLAIQSSVPLVQSEPDIAAEFAALGVADRAIGVVYAGLHIAFKLNASRPTTMERLTCTAYDRVLEREAGAEVTTRDVLDGMLYLAGSGHVDATDRMRSLAEEPWTSPHSAVILVGLLAESLRPSAAIEVRLYRHGLLLDIVRRSVDRLLRTLASSGDRLDRYEESDRISVEACLRILRNASERLYFCSGTIDRAAPHGLGSDSGNIDAEEFALLSPLLESLATIPFAASTYNVIKTLLGAIDGYPTQALSIAVAAIQRAGDSIAMDHLAEDDVRIFVLRYIREHRGLLATSPSALSGIMDIVDLFVDAGWPQWIDVFYELDRVYRE